MTLAADHAHDRDAEARQAIRTALDDTLIVEAAAGTGKTTELVRRILCVLAVGKATVDQLVAVTFTEKAAGELKLRLRQELEVARETEPDAVRGRRLEGALENLEDAHISTIHGFCADLLRERPVEACLDPLFVVLTEGQARRLFDEAFAGWLHGALEAMPDGVRRSLRRSSRPATGRAADADGPIGRLRAACWNLAEWRDFEAPWTRPTFARESAIDDLTRAVHAFAEVTRHPTSPRDFLHLDTAAARRASDELRLIDASGDRDAAEGILIDLCRDRDFRRAKKGHGVTFGAGVPRADLYACHQELVQRLDAFKIDADADVAALLREELRDGIAAYQRIKTARGAVDFLDLLLKTRALLRDRDDVRGDFQRRFACLFVDEFQDTDPLQAEILLLLTADDPTQRDWRSTCPLPGKLFIVGDPKQSIYRFRRADIGMYRTVCEQLTCCGARRLFLTTSFRSTPRLQQAINRAFAAVMTGNRETLQANYVGLAPHRSEIDGQPAIVALPVPMPYGTRNISGAAIEQSLPDAVGAFVAWLVGESGWTVVDTRAGGARVPVQPRHVCILFRRFVSFGNDVTRPYVDALEARGLRHLLVGGRAFHGREEIETLRAALTAVEWPDDELSVFATLRGALFAIGDEELLEYRHHHAKAFHPFRIPESVPERLEPIRAALRLLAALHWRRNRRPVAETIARLLDATRAHVALALRRAGEQALANTLHVSELARQYELAGGISFRGFVDELRDAADEGHAAEAPIVEEGSDGVRLMTVHKAKGLEFPVVVLADITAKIAATDASRYVDAERGLCALRIGGWSPQELVAQQAIEQARDREEGVRVAYVAATRARDLLVVPAVGDGEYQGGWVEPLHAVIYPPRDRRRHGEPAVGCPAFRKDSVLVRPDDGMALSTTVSPGRHVFEDQSGRFDVVWWDPKALTLGVEPPFGLRREELIAKNVAPEIVAEGARRYRDWRQDRDAAVAVGRVPSVRVRTATEWAHDDRADPPDERPTVEYLEIAPSDGASPGASAGPRYGTLVHAVLASTPLDADPSAIAAMVRLHARVTGSDEEEIACAVAAVTGALRHPVLVLARGADVHGRCFREIPVALVRDGTLLEGVVDLAFEHDGTMLVVDFKTDRAEGVRRAHYERQVALYAEAIARASGQPARAILLGV